MPLSQELWNASLNDSRARSGGGPGSGVATMGRSCWAPLMASDSLASTWSGGYCVDKALRNLSIAALPCGVLGSSLGAGIVRASGGGGGLSKGLLGSLIPITPRFPVKPPSLLGSTGGLLPGEGGPSTGACGSVAVAAAACVVAGSVALGYISL
ncbi:Uncharacterised protein [Mycobacteroides abscessus subsp. abscessus]|nr:Uncharacterised protein [Mycobacteroides abscessus subsp. abscessus]SHW68849.1 Uncharacterised protein [Mycobacteroides abscessus subsp. abscessus]